MNAPKNRGQGNNQSADTGPIVQPGEDADAIAALQGASAAPPAAVDQFINEANAPVTPNGMQEGEGLGAPAGQLVAREMSKEEMQAVLQSILNTQAQMASMISKLARNNPVFGRHDNEQSAEVPLTTLEMPVDGSLDAMRRPDQRVEGVDLDISRNMDHAAQMAFLEEYLVVNIHDTAEEGAENPVCLWVNGRGVAIPRGQDMAVRRKYVELLLRAKPEKINTRITRGADGEPRNHIDKTRSLKYPFSIVLDRNPRGVAWARKVRAEA